MKTRAILSATGRDRVGVASDLTAALTQRRIEVEDSRMTSLGGRFAIIAEVSGKHDDVTALGDSLTTVGANLGFDLQLETLTPESPTPTAALRPYSLECFSSRPVGLNAVTGLLLRHGVNIEDLETETSAGPCTDRLTFYMRARVGVPSSCAVDRLNEELRRIERDQDLDIVIEPLPSTSRGRPAVTVER
jgi:glycine cleavage system transcriptional repressor